MPLSLDFNTPVLSDALTGVNRLSLAFQCTSVDLSIIRPLLTSILTTLEKLKDEAPTCSLFEDKVRSLITTEMNEEAIELDADVQSREDSDTGSCDDRETEPLVITITSSELQRFEAQVHQSSSLK